MSCHSLFFLRKIMNLDLYICSFRSIWNILRTSLMSRNHIKYIIPHDQLLFFDHSFFHSILFFILSYLSYPWWCSSFKVDLLLSKAFSSIMVSLTLGASDFIGVNLELSLLVLWNKSHPYFVVGGCTRPFLQLKCTSCMVITIS